jgi:hypothetical protein
VIEGVRLPLLCLPVGLSDGAVRVAAQLAGMISKPL